MDDLTMWSLLVGALMPNAIAIVNQPRWPAWAKGAATVVLCLIAGGMTAHLQGELHGRRVLSAALVVTFAALVAYRHFWKPTGIAPALERATAPEGRHRAEP